MTDVPLHVTEDKTLRVKILDPCGLACTFCHSEGTPITADQREGLPIVAAGRSGRVSIYAETNGVDFLPATMLPGEAFGEAIGKLRDALGFSELHLTGGEPTLHPKLAGLVSEGVAAGYSVRLTSNGENGARTIPAAAAAGLQKVNFSIFGTTPAELAEVQAPKYASIGLAERKLAALKASIRTCAEHGVKADANIVVPDYSHAHRVHRLLDEYAGTVSVRLLNSLDSPTSVGAIHRILAERGAVPVARYVTAGVSGARTKYRLPSGREVFFKQIRPVRLPTTCAGCRFNNSTDCQEGYYGLRLYAATDGRWIVGVCIQRMDLALELEEFLASDYIDEIKALRGREAAQLGKEPKGAR